MNNVQHYPKISTVSQPEIVLIRTDDFRPSKLTVRLIVCLLVSKLPVSERAISGAGPVYFRLDLNPPHFRRDFPDI